jgi:hypothetical protein
MHIKTSGASRELRNETTKQNRILQKKRCLKCIHHHLRSTYILLCLLTGIMIQLIALGTGNVSDVAMMTIQHVMLYVIDTIDLMWPAATSHLLRGPV